MIESKDISVIVQGAADKKLTPKCLKSIRKFLPEAEIILSTWENTDVKGLDFDKLVLSNDPGGTKHIYAITKEHCSMNNFNRQLVSTQNGIKKAERKYILKLRTDLILKNSDFLKYWDKFNERNNQFIIFNHRVLVSTIYSREYSSQSSDGYPMPFHPSDFWFFGEKEDLINYFINCPMQTKEEAGNWNYKYPVKSPYSTASYRYAPEQQFCYNWVKKYYPDVKFDDWTDWNEENIEFSNNILYNNFIFLGFLQSDIYSKKYYASEHSQNDIQGLITYEHFIKQYKKYCDDKYIICSESLLSDYLGLNSNLIKLRKHWLRFLEPFKILGKSISGLIGLIYYISCIIFNIIIFPIKFLYKISEMKNTKKD